MGNLCFRRRKKDRLVRAVSTDTDEDVEDIINRQKNLKNTRNRPQMSTRKEKPKTRSVSKASNHPTEDSDDDIQIVSVTKAKRKSPRSRRRKISPDRSTNRSVSPDVRSLRTRASSTQPTRRARAASPGSQSLTSYKCSLNRQNSDSSSGKEFTQSKMIRESYVSLQRLSIGEKDFTHSPEGSGVDSSRTLTKQEAFALKNNLQNYVKEMRNVARKIIEEAEFLQRSCTKKETLKSQEATRLVLECKNRFSDVKESIETNEKKFVDKFRNWCKKAKVKNLFVSLSQPDVDTPDRLGPRSKKRSNEVVPQSSDEEENDNKGHHFTSSQYSREGTPEVSECDEDIFSQDEAKSKTKNESHSSARGDKVLSPVQENTSEASHGERPASVATNDSRSKQSDRNDHDESSNDIFAGESDFETNEASQTDNKGNLSDSGHMSEEEHVSSTSFVRKKSTICTSESSDKENSKRNQEKEGKKRESRSKSSGRRSSDHSAVENAANADEKVKKAERIARKKKESAPLVDTDVKSSDDEKRSKWEEANNQKSGKSPNASDAEEKTKKSSKSDESASEEEKSVRSKKKSKKISKFADVAETEELPSKPREKKRKRRSSSVEPSDAEKQTETVHLALDTSNDEEKSKKSIAKKKNKMSSPKVSNVEEAAKQKLLASDSSSDEEVPKTPTDHDMQRGATTSPLPDAKKAKETATDSDAASAEEKEEEPKKSSGDKSQESLIASDAEETVEQSLLDINTAEETEAPNESDKLQKRRSPFTTKASSPPASDTEERAKESLLNSDTSEGDAEITAEPEKPTKKKKLSPTASNAKGEAKTSSAIASDVEEEVKAYSPAAPDVDQPANALSSIPSNWELDTESRRSPADADAEEKAKEALLNSDQSTDELESPTTSQKKGESSLTASDVEEKAKQALLNSDTSSDETEKLEFLEESRKDKSSSGDGTLDDTQEVVREDLSANFSVNEAEKQTKSKKEKSKKREKSEEGSKLDVSATNEMSDLEERAKKTLLASDSSSDETEALKNSTLNAEEPAAKEQLQVSDSEKENDKRKNLPQKASGRDSDRASDVLIGPKAKRRKFNYKDNEHYKSDSKLRQRCTVKLERLSNRILRRHARALKKSKEYLENKELASLTSLDRLEKIRKRDCGGNSSDSDGTSTSPIKKKASKKTSDTLLDHLNVNGETVDSDNVTSSDDSDGLGKNQKSGDLQDEAELMAKDALLESSDEEKLAPAASEDDDEDDESSNTQKKKSEEKQSKKSESSKSEKSEWKRSKLLTMKLSSSDSDEQTEKAEKKVKRLSQNVENSDNSENADGSGKKKKRVRRRRLNSDSDVKLTDESSSDGESKDSGKAKKGDNKKSKKRAKKVDNSSDSSSTSRSRPKPKRRRVRTAGTDSDSDVEELPSSQNSPNKGSGRKNIRKVLKDKQVADDTKQAAKQEEERLRRMAERQKLYNEMYEARLAGEEKVDKLILDFDEESKEELLSVHEALVKRLKPHQAQGIKFMWDACFESLERATTTKGSGCILAHCMGLGKSFQVVTLAHTLLSNSEKTGVNTVLVVCPLSTVLNWANEFKIWLNDVNDGNDVEVFELTKFKKNYERKYQLEQWQKHGGVLIIGYEMYRNLSNPAKKLNKKLKESFFKCLVEPGPDLVVCDEGHLLKSESTAISKAMTKIRTLRRIVLTGTPLQNNLAEYHCMVQFVKPNLLGTKKEFLNRFVNPIQNGQFDDSTEYDVKLMKKRAHVLHKMLEGSVQRFDYSVLTPFLPPKQEYVIFVKLSDVQIKLYQYYIDNLARRHRAAGGSLFADFQALQRVWTHPIAIKLNAEKVAEKRLMNESDSEGSLKDFIDDGSDSDSSSSSSGSVASTTSSKRSESAAKSEGVAKRATRANPVAEDPAAEEQPVTDAQWWSQFLEDDHFEDLRISSKLRILFEILKESEAIGDKVLVFSQSLYSLTLIEKFLAAIDDETQRGTTSDFIDGHTGSWSLGLDYFRLDGQTPTEHRSMWCKTFNKPSNTRARLFLISTRAGGLGINLTAANRVVIFDASWNPSHDVQSIFRIYRFGQKKPCYVYRLLAAGTMEEKIYNRQVTKLSLSCRVVDEQQIERHYAVSDLNELYTFDKPPEETTGLGCPKDRLLAEIFYKYKDLVRNYHEHDSLLENKADEELDEEERKQAWLEYEQEKAGRPPVNPMPMFNYQDPMMMQQLNQQMLNPFALNGSTMQSELTNLLGMYQKDFPNMTPEQQKMMATKALMEMYSYMENHHVMSNRVNTMPVGAHGYSNPTNTLANQLAQQAYTRHHQQVKQMNAAAKQIQYAQQFGNYKTVPVPQNPNVAMRHVPSILQQRATISNDPEIMEITPTTPASNSSAQSSGGQGEGRKNQEE